MALPGEAEIEKIEPERARGVVWPRLRGPRGFRAVTERTAGVRQAVLRGRKPAEFGVPNNPEPMDLGHRRLRHTEFDDVAAGRKIKTHGSSFPGKKEHLCAVHHDGGAVGQIRAGRRAAINKIAPRSTPLLSGKPQACFQRIDLKHWRGRLTHKPHAAGHRRHEILGRFRRLRPRPLG